MPQKAVRVSTAKAETRAFYLWLHNYGKFTVLEKRKTKTTERLTYTEFWKVVILVNRLRVRGQLLLRKVERCFSKLGKERERKVSFPSIRRGQQAGENEPTWGIKIAQCITSITTSLPKGVRCYYTLRRNALRMTIDRLMIIWQNVPPRSPYAYTSRRSTENTFLLYVHTSCCSLVNPYITSEMG